MKIYLDTCTLQRPLDSKTQIRINLEAEAVLGIIGLQEAGTVELVSSEVLIYEVKRNPKSVRREFGLEILSKAGEVVSINEAIEYRAKQLEAIGIKALDALHLASAEEAGVDFFCTCDDRFLKKAKAVSDLRVQTVSPIELIEVLEDGS